MVGSLPTEPVIKPFKYADLLDEPFASDDWRAALKKDGYVVIPCLSHEKAMEYRSRAFDWVEAFGLGFDRNDEKTWTQDHMPLYHRGGMYTYEGHGLSHEQWVWDIRTEPAVIGAFQKLWGTDKLVCSFDGASIMMPPPDRDENTPAPPEAHWEHIDLSPSREGFFLVQGIMNLQDNGPHDGGLQVMKGSSVLMKEFFDQRGRPPIPPTHIDSYSFTLEEKQWFVDKGCEWIKVTANAGDLILWDSGTMHQNTPPTRRVDRVVTYVCMGPAEELTPEDHVQRQRAWKEGKPTTHAPFQGAQCRDPIPQPLRNGKPCPVADKRIQPVKPTDQILKLAGMVPY